MTRPLGSTPTAPSRGFTATTSRSASTPRDGTHCLPVSAARQAPSRRPLDRGQQCRGVPSHVPCKSRRPGSRRLHAGHRLAKKNGHPPDSSRADLLHPGFDATLLSNDTSAAIPETRTAHRLPDPHLTPLVRLFHIAHHDGLQPTQHVVVCSLPPHGRLRRAKPSSPAQHHVQKLYLQTELPSTFVAHVGSQIRCPFLI
jgi:hypothetical protein